MSNAAANADAARLLATLTVAEDGPQATAELMRLLAQHTSGGKQTHEANIIATMLAHGIPRLLTFSEAGFRRFNVLIEVVTP